MREFDEIGVYVVEERGCVFKGGVLGEEEVEPLEDVGGMLRVFKAMGLVLFLTDGVEGELGHAAQMLEQQGESQLAREGE